MNFKSYAVSLAGAGTLALASTANAQTAKAGTQAADTEPLDVVMVTGSRVITNGNDSPTPVTVVSMEDMTAVRPTTVADALNDLPVFSGSRGQTTNASAGVVGGAAQPNSASNVMNLRNMGVLRTLILFDGHRVSPSSPDGSVDVDMIPQLLLKRVDVVTGGASAVYGSDAVTGVVNFVTDTRFQGLKVDLQGGMSGESDDKTVDGGIAFGTSLFGDRGHFEASYGLRTDPGLMHRSEREWGRQVWTVQGTGTAASPYHLVRNTRIATSTFGGYVNNNANNVPGVLSDREFTANGVLTPFVHGTPTGTPGYESGGDGAFNDTSVKARLDMHQLFGRFDYDLADGLHGYATVVGNYNHNANFYAYNALSQVTFGRQNAFLPSAYQSQLAAAGQQTFRFSKTFLDVPSQATDTWERQYFVIGGLDGKFANDYKWDLAYTHSYTKQNTRQNANIDNRRLSAALDAVVDPASGQVVCNVSLTNPGLYPGCVPLNVFGPTSESQAAIGYIVKATQFWATTTMDDVTASVTGSPFSTWAGPVNLAVSGEWRKLTYELVSDAQPTDPVSCTGLRFNCNTATQAWADGASANRSPVSQTVREGALEVDLPILKDHFLAQAVDINSAARYTYYSTSGSATTWKGGLDWHFNDQLALRGTRSRDIRAPTLADLFFPTTLGSIQVTDLLTGQNPLVPQVTSGNPNLKPEIGYTTTVGFVFRPTEKFSLALDAFDIKVSNAILNQQGTNPAAQKVCYASGGTSPYCSLQERPNGFSDTSPANAVTKWYNRVINIAVQKTWGADLEANLAVHVFGGPLDLRTLVTYQPHIIYETPGLTTVDMGGAAFSSNAVQASPVWRVTLFARYRPIENLTVDVMERWRSSLAYTGDPTMIVSSPNISSVAYTNLNLSYRTGPADVFLNVQNLFDKQPPPAAFYGGGGAVGTFGGFVYGDDPIGRYITLGARLRF